MRLWATLAAAAALAGLLAGIDPAPARADEAPAPEAGRQAVAVFTMVRARDLMSAADRQAYRRAMREAGSEQARREVREAALERLRQRAAEHGVVVVLEARALRPGERVEFARPERPAAPPPRAP